MLLRCGWIDNSAAKAYRYSLAPLVSNQYIGLFLPSKTVAIPYTCGLSRLFSGVVAGEHSSIYKLTWEVLSCFLLALSFLLPSIVFLLLVLLTSFAKWFSGVAELTIQLLRLTGILWLPLCQINKLGYTYPQRLLWFPTLVGYQDYFLALLPGSIALSISSLGKYTLTFHLFLVFILLVKLNGKQQKYERTL